MRLIDKEKAKKALRTYWETDQQDIAEELAQIFNPLAVPFWQHWMKGEQNLPEGVLPRISDLTLLKELTGLKRLYLRNTAVADVSVLDLIEGLHIVR